MKKLFFLFICLTISSIISAQTPAQLAGSVEKSFRGLSVVDSNTVWISGPKGLVGITNNAFIGGREVKWNWNQIKRFEKSDFRSIYAFDKKRAVVASAGFPAAILYTNDAGKNWTTSYISKDSAMFFDGIDFWDNEHGMVFGDPINGRMYLAETFDGGKTWKEISFADRPQLQKGEASFAASGTTIRVMNGGQIWIATGGNISRIWHSRDYGHHWEVIETPILQGKSSQGIFSFAFYDTLHGIIVGGDYLIDTLKKNNCFLTNDGGRTWIMPEKTIGGYRSGVEYINAKTLVAIGPSDMESSDDGGNTWSSMGWNGNTVRRVKNAAFLYSCGGYGFSKIGFSDEVRAGNSEIH